MASYGKEMRALFRGEGREREGGKCVNMCHEDVFLHFLSTGKNVVQVYPPPPGKNYIFLKISSNVRL